VTVRPVFAPLTLIFVALPMSVLWLVLGNDSWVKLGYVALVTAVTLDLLRATYKQRKG